MTPDQAKKLEAMSGQGKPVRFKHKGRQGYQEIGEVVDEVYIMSDDYKHLLQKIKFKDGVSWDESKFGYRTGYYTYDGQMKKIKWGQYTQFLTEKEYKALLSKAKEKGWI